MLSAEFSPLSATTMEFFIPYFSFISFTRTGMVVYSDVLPGNILKSTGMPRLSMTRAIDTSGKSKRCSLDKPLIRIGSNSSVNRSYSLSVSSCSSPLNIFVSMSFRL